MTIQINTVEEYQNCKEQVIRQTIERDNLTLVIDEVAAACLVWENDHPPEPEPEA